VLVQDAFLGACHDTVTLLVTPFVYAAVPADLDPYLMSGTRGTQPADILHACHLVLERRLDMACRAAVSQSDISACFDRLGLSRIYLRLCDVGMPPPQAAACVRVQLLPVIVPEIADTTTVIGERVCGLTTGSKSAGLFQRLPMAYGRCSSGCLQRHAATQFSL